MSVQPYLFFDGRCEEALKFYQAAVGAEVQMLVRNRDAPDPPASGPHSRSHGERIPHVAFIIGDSVVMASDSECGGEPNFAGFGLALSLPDAAAVDQAFSALSVGGTVDMPPAKTFFSARFGMLRDRFGVRWMVSAAP